MHFILSDVLVCTMLLYWRISVYKATFTWGLVCIYKATFNWGLVCTKLPYLQIYGDSCHENITVSSKAADCSHMPIEQSKSANF